MYGIAEARFLQLNLRCGPSASHDLHQLRQVAAAFAAAGRAPYQPASANLDLKVDFGLGRAYVCLSLAGADYRAQASAHLSQVLAAVDPPTRPQTPTLISLAAEPTDSSACSRSLNPVAQPTVPASRPRSATFSGLSHSARPTQTGRESSGPTWPLSTTSSATTLLPPRPGSKPKRTTSILSPSDEDLGIALTGRWHLP
jgi:hypothetical protein